MKNEQISAVNNNVTQIKIKQRRSFSISTLSLSLDLSPYLHELF